MADSAGGQWNGHAPPQYSMNASYQGQYIHTHSPGPSINRSIPYSGAISPTSERNIQGNTHSHIANSHQTTSGLQPNGYQHSQKAYAVAIPRNHTPSKLNNENSHGSDVQQHSQSSPPLDHEVLLLALADEYFAAAYGQGAENVARRNNEPWDYSTLIATGLGCLEAVLKNFTLKPEREAMIRLRYAKILFEETENSLEAEEIVNRGIMIAMRHRLFDLKCNMQHLLARMLFQKNSRAAFVFLDRVISDVEAYQHIAWVYAFRLLKASLLLELSSHQDMTAAISHFRHVAALATDFGDKNVRALAVALEALACLRISCDRESFEQAQRALASVRSLQMDPSFTELPQLTLLVAFLDLSCYLQHFDPAQAIQKMQIMQSVLAQVGEDRSWAKDGSFAIKLPHARMASCKGRDGVLREEEDGSLTLMFNWVPKDDIYNVGYFLSALAMAHRNCSDGQKSEQMLKDGIRREKLAQIESSKTPKSRMTAASLQSWREEVTCYMRLQLALTLCARSSWSAAKDQLSELNRSVALRPETPKSVHHMTRYLSAVISQGTGDLPSALAIYRNYPITPQATSQNQITAQYMTDVSVLATLNTLLIIRSPSHPLHHNHAALIRPLTDLCVHHPNRQIQAAYHLIAATLPISSTTLLTKQSLQAALQAAKLSDNNELMCVILNLMSWKFFRGLLGEQAEKSARASQMLARKGSNALWMSVSAGVLAETLEAAGRGEEAEASRNEGLMRAKEFPEKIREVMCTIGEELDTLMSDA